MKHEHITKGRGKETNKEEKEKIWRTCLHEEMKNLVGGEDDWLKWLKSLHIVTLITS